MGSHKTILSGVVKGVSSQEELCNGQCALIVLQVKKVLKFQVILVFVRLSVCLCVVKY